jgi:hypothetical protein
MLGVIGSLLAGKADDGTPPGTPRPWTTPDIAVRTWHSAGAMPPAWALPAITASEAAPTPGSLFTRRFEAQLRWKGPIRNNLITE